MRIQPLNNMIENCGGMFIDKETNTALGYLISFNDCVFSTDGAVKITKAEAEIHNAALDAAMIKGLDENCKIGQGGVFYFTNKGVTTFCGTVLDATPIVEKKKVKTIVFFQHARKLYRGIVQKDAQCVNFKRIE